MTWYVFLFFLGSNPTTLQRFQDPMAHDSITISRFAIWKVRNSSIWISSQRSVEPTPCVLWLNEQDLILIQCSGLDHEFVFQYFKKNAPFSQLAISEFPKFGMPLSSNQQPTLLLLIDSPYLITILHFSIWNVKQSLPLTFESTKRLPFTMFPRVSMARIFSRSNGLDRFTIFECLTNSWAYPSRNSTGSDAWWIFLKQINGRDLSVIQKFISHHDFTFRDFKG